MSSSGEFSAMAMARPSSTSCSGYPIAGSVSMMTFSAARAEKRSKKIIAAKKYFFIALHFF
jgi:hypothetical protein